MNEEQANSPRILLIGYGNPARGDDKAGWLVADRIEERWGNRIDVLRFHQLDIMLAEQFANYDVVVFVDAETTDLGQGRPPTLLQPSLELREVTHILEPASVLGICKAVYHAEPKAYLVTVSAQTFEFVGTISPETRRDIDRAVADIDELLDGLMDQSDSFS